MHGGNRDVVLKEVDRNDCYKQKGVAGNVHIELVSDGSLDSKLMWIKKSVYLNGADEIPAIDNTFDKFTPVGMNIIS